MVKLNLLKTTGMIAAATAMTAVITTAAIQAAHTVVEVALVEILLVHADAETAAMMTAAQQEEVAYHNGVSGSKVA